MFVTFFIFIHIFLFFFLKFIHVVFLINFQIIIIVSIIADYYIPDADKFITDVEKLKLHCCAYCDYRTPRKGDFTRHVLIHTGEKRFSCNLCGRRFVRKSHLLNHLKTHSKQKMTY